MSDEKQCLKECSIERELIVIAKADAKMRVNKEGLVTSEKYPNGATAMTEILKSKNAFIRTLFRRPEEWLKAELDSWQKVWRKKRKDNPPDLSLYYLVLANDGDLDELAKKLFDIKDLVDAAYVTPPAELPQWTTKDFYLLGDQKYLKPAPGGIDAEYAWSDWGTRGGRGKDVNIIDIEKGWCFSHEDLKVNCGGGLIGGNSSNIDYRNHGTAVLGIMSGDHNGLGIHGICPEAYIRTIGVNTITTAEAIYEAMSYLKAGDIMLIEIHRKRGLSTDDYIPVEWWPHIFAPIVYSTVLGIIVVEAGGNGKQDLDSSIYDNGLSGFSDDFDWSNPFNPANSCSDAVIVGAGQPPQVTPAPPTYHDRVRCNLSNYGSRIDAQGWGRAIVTTGYGKKQGPESGIPAELFLPEDLWYTNTFGGTSGAAPMVAGALACVQGILLNERKPILTSISARDLLRVTGSHQETDPPGDPITERIGNRPNLVELIAEALS